MHAASAVDNQCRGKTSNVGSWCMPLSFCSSFSEKSWKIEYRRWYAEVEGSLVVVRTQLCM